MITSIHFFFFIYFGLFKRLKNYITNFKWIIRIIYYTIIDLQSIIYHCNMIKLQFYIAFWMKNIKYFENFKRIKQLKGVIQNRSKCNFNLN